jgi:hypothetical protein
VEGDRGFQVSDAQGELDTGHDVPPSWDGRLIKDLSNQPLGVSLHP